MTFVWSILIISLLNYVVGAIANIPFNFEAGIIISLVMAVLVIILGESMPDEAVSDH